MRLAVARLTSTTPATRSTRAVDGSAPRSGRSAQASQRPSGPPAGVAQPERASSHATPPARAASAGTWPVPVVTDCAE